MSSCFDGSPDRLTDLLQPMTRTPTFSPRSHEGGPFPSTSDAARVDDEYVFTTVVETRPEADLLRFSVRVDPSDGPPDELVLHVDRRVEPEASPGPPRRDAAAITVAAPNLGSPPRVGALESVLETWCRRHWRDDFDEGGEDALGVDEGGEDTMRADEGGAERERSRRDVRPGTGAGARADTVPARR
jgi:hypothetical protein